MTQSEKETFVKCLENLNKGILLCDEGFKAVDKKILELQTVVLTLNEKIKELENVDIKDNREKGEG